MRFSILIAGLCAFAASNVAAQYLNQSAPFYLLVLSPTNSTINGSTLASCHEGAAIEGLCLAGKPPVSSSFSTFTFNTSTTPVIVTAGGAQGYLTYELVGGNFQISEPMQLEYNPTSNVALPLFEPSSSGTIVSFDNNNMLNIQGYIDDTKSPPGMGVAVYYRWYICTTYGSYTYRTLAWKMGRGSPENPTCVKVDVMRVFV